MLKLTRIVDIKMTMEQCAVSLFGIIYSAFLFITAYVVNFRDFATVEPLILATLNFGI